MLLVAVGVVAVSTLGWLVELAIEHGLLRTAAALALQLRRRALQLAELALEPDQESTAPRAAAVMLLMSFCVLVRVNATLGVMLGALRPHPTPRASRADPADQAAVDSVAEPIGTKPLATTRDTECFPWRVPVRGAGEWARVDPTALEPPLRAAYQQLCSRVSGLQAHEEFDALRALQSRALHIEKTVAWLARHREWTERYRPAEKRFAARHPGVLLQFYSGMARFVGCNKAGRVYFYADVSRWAPHLAPSGDDFLAFTVAGLELMKEAARLFSPGEPLCGGIIDISGWAFWHAGYLHYVLRFLAMFLEHYPRSIDKLYLLNAPPIFAHAWAVTRRALDEWTRERVVFVNHRQIKEGYFVERFERRELYACLGGERDDAELSSLDNLPGFPLQPGTNVPNPDLIYDWRKGRANLPKELFP